MFSKKTLVASAITGLLLISCRKPAQQIVIGTTVITQITISSAQSGGFIASGSAARYGVCWATHPGPTISDSLTIDGSGAGNYISKFHGLDPGQLYYVRAYGTNELGTSYGNEYSFTTLGGKPACETAPASFVTAATAILNGKVNCNYLWTTVSFEYGPDKNYGKIIAANRSPLTGSVETSVDAQVTGDLIENTFYHYRIIARNSLGEDIGEDMVFKTLPPNGTKDIVTDIDGNIYETIVVNAQIWMTQNLKVKHLNDGTAIPFISDPSQWGSTVDPAYGWYDNNPDDNYGLVYNWYTVGTEKICPAGWHVPNIEEWDRIGQVNLFDVFVGYDSRSICGYRSCVFWWGTKLSYGAWTSADAAYISFESYSLAHISQHLGVPYYIRCLKDDIISEN